MLLSRCRGRVALLWRCSRALFCDSLSWFPPVVMQVPVTIAVTGMVRLHTAFHAMHEPPWVDWCPVRQLGVQTPDSLLPAPNSLFLSPPIIVQGYPMMDFVVRELRAVVRGPMAMLRCVLVAHPALCRCNAPPLRLSSHAVYVCD